MDLTLVFSALMLGLAGVPHCAAMCGAPCAAVAPRGQGGAQALFHVARVAGYALAGAVMASSVGALAALGQLSPALRPLWTLVHAAGLGLGLSVFPTSVRNACYGLTQRSHNMEFRWHPIKCITAC